MFTYEFRCQSCSTMIECLRKPSDIYAPTCDCGAPPGGMKRVYSTASFHRKPDPNHERDRARHEMMIADGKTPITKREADMLEHNVNKINRDAKAKRLQSWEKAVDDTIKKVGGWNPDG